MDEVRVSLEKKLEGMKTRFRMGGYTDGPDGHLIPPGYKMVKIEEEQGGED